MYDLICFSLSCMLLVGLTQSQCTDQLSPCSCQAGDGVIDLSPLQNTDGTPRFKDIPDDAGAESFSYNPCSGFTEGDCLNAGVCQVQDGTPASYYTIGDPDSAVFGTNENNDLQITYDSTQGNVYRQSFVDCICDKSQEGTLSAKGEDPNQPTKYYLTLTSKYCCSTSGNGPHNGEVTISISAGSILLILFFTVLPFYFIVGVVFQTFARKRSGSERLPNAGFWIALPGYVKDGFLFTICRWKRKSYDQV